MPQHTGKEKKASRAKPKARKAVRSKHMSAHKPKKGKRGR